MASRSDPSAPGARVVPAPARALPPEWVSTDRSRAVAAAHASPSLPALLVFDIARAAGGVPLGNGLHTIGRGTRCEVCLQDLAVSRRHCQLRVDAGSIWLKDLDSTNGTYVNGRRVEHRELVFGEVIGVGGATLRLVREDSPEWQAQRSLAELASNDDLTGLLNRRGLRARVDAALARPGAAGGHALLMIDADHFKSINDRHGHETGDRAIRQIGNCVRALLPEAAFAGRIGGEEFAVVMAPPAAEQALAWAELLRETIAGVPVATAAGPVAVTVSIGIAFGSFPLEVRALFARADKALYRAKSEGRNRVCV